MERVMGIEPTRPAWKAGILAIELHPRFFGKDYNNIIPAVSQAKFQLFIGNNKIFFILYVNF